MLIDELWVEENCGARGALFTVRVPANLRQSTASYQPSPLLISNFSKAVPSRQRTTSRCVQCFLLSVNSFISTIEVTGLLR